LALEISPDTTHNDYELLHVNGASLQKFSFVAVPSGRVGVVRLVLVVVVVDAEPAVVQRIQLRSWNFRIGGASTKRGGVGVGRRDLRRQISGNQVSML